MLRTGILLAVAALTVSARTLVSTVEAESMTYSGFTGSCPASVSFSGLRFYGNGDRAGAALRLSTVPGRYSVEVRGASTNSSAASISVLLGTTRVAVSTHSSTTPSTSQAAFDVHTRPAPDSLYLLMEEDNGSFDIDVDWVKLWYEGEIPPPPPAPIPPAQGAFQTGRYRNLFSEIGKTDQEVRAKLDTAWNRLFYGSDSDQRVYYPVGTDMAYILDAGNNDVRSEGMSYGMMICVQMDKKSEFDRLWKWARTYMYNTDGEWKGYYAWQVGTNGTKIDRGSAPDGEEYFAMALFFASHRWGDGQGIFNYGAMARELLDEMLHHEERVNQYSSIKNMFNAREKKVVFSPNNTSALFTDPSYHLPSFYELWALWAGSDKDFWKAAADTSRAFFKRTTHPQTGLSPDYAEFSGAPNNTGNHGDFRFDAWRTAQNIATDYGWWARDPWQKEFADRIQAFFESEGIGTYGNQYRLDGTRLSSDQSPGLVAMNAVASLAATNARAWQYVEALWNLPVPSGKWRYYDGMLYFMGLLHCSGQFRIHAPDQTSSTGIGRGSQRRSNERIDGPVFDALGRVHSGITRAGSGVGILSCPRFRERRLLKD